MKFTKIAATSFGPLHGEELEFAPGLNVVVGPNEARKSSWHAAMYAGLCGRRRGKGRVADDQAFEDRHRPWHHSEWVVRAEIELDDGRAIELRHDLDQRRSDVTDLEFGRPVEDDIVHDGTPDGSKWLGLDRKTFLATACVRQAEILAVADEPAGMRSLLQRAATTLGGDVTASAAIAQLVNYRKEHVGRDQANSSRPLRRAKLALSDASEQSERAVEAHHEYQALVAQAERVSAELEIADHELRAAEQGAELARARTELHETETIVELAAELERVEATAVEETDLDDVREALAQWSVSVAPRELTGETAAELEAQIEAIPPAPQGDVAVDLAVDELAANLSRVRSAIDSMVEPVASGIVDPELDHAIDMAQLATAPPPTAPLDVVGEYERLSMVRRAHQRQLHLSQLAMRLAGLGGVVAIVVALLGVIPIAVVVGAGSALVAAASWALVRSTQSGDEERRVAVESRLRDHEALVVEQVERSREAREWLEARRLPVDVAQVTQLVAERNATHSMYVEYVQRRDALEREASGVVVALLELLAAKGIGDDDVDAALSAYSAMVDENRRAAELRSRLPDLEQRLVARTAAEVDAAAQLDRHHQAGRRLIDLVAEHDLPAPADDAHRAAEGAESLLARQDEIRRQALRAHQLRAELSTRLGGHQLDEVVARRDELTELVERADSDREADRNDPAADVAGATRRRTELSEQLAEIRGRLASIDDAAVDTAAAHAAVEAARREVQRVEELGETLDLTCKYLAAAEEEAYRTVAPQIAAQLNEHLATLTGGRYTDAVVDPEHLTVRVRDAEGVLRDADRLSHGTAEQIHLLLRIAMARTLTRPGESCPLLIDDATVHADAERTEAVLDLLLDLAADRQVVLFSQELHVREWAERSLGLDRHRLIDLEAA